MSSKAWSELDRRRDLGRLSKGDEHAITEAALTVQQVPNAGPGLALALNHLGRRWEAGELDDQQTKRMFSQCVVTTWTSRPYVAVGDTNLMASVSIRCRLPMLPSQRPWSLYLNSDAGTLRGAVDPREILSAGFGWQVSFDAAGKRETDLNESIEIRLGAPNQPIETLQRTHRVAFNVLPAEEIQAMRRVRSPSIGKQVRNSLHITECRYIFPDERYLALKVIASPPPVDLALDVFIRAAGREHALGTLKLKSNSNAVEEPSLGEFIMLEAEKVDVILRPSEAVANQDFDIFQYWGEEVIFKNVPVHYPKQLARPDP